DVLAGRLVGAQWADPGGRTRILADPMILPGTQGRVALCESLDHAGGRGGITRVELAANNTMENEATNLSVADHPVLDIPGVHLSYPGMAAADDGVVLMPEASSTRGLLTAVLGTEGASVRRLNVANGMAPVDPSLFTHDGRWWL